MSELVNILSILAISISGVIITNPAKAEKICKVTAPTGTPLNARSCSSLKKTGGQETATSTTLKQESIKPVFTAKISPIPQYMQVKMTGVTWYPQCPITLDQLVLLEVSHWDSQGQSVVGKLILNRDVAVPVSTVLKDLFLLKFPINSMRPAYEFGGDDRRSMAANNTSAFNCRPVEGSQKWSEHAYGKAIDINPLVNPYIKKNVVLPPQGRLYVNRANNVPGMIRAGSPVVEAFRRIGWKWGGNWRTLKDYQHFSHNGF